MILYNITAVVAVILRLADQLYQYSLIASIFTVSLIFYADKKVFFFEMCVKIRQKQL